MYFGYDELKGAVVSAQMLYDVRELTGEISGQDLHELFRRVIGEPSPSGKIMIEESRLIADEVGSILLLQATSPLFMNADKIKEQHDIP